MEPILNPLNGAPAGGQGQVGDEANLVPQILHAAPADEQGQQATLTLNKI